MKYEKIFWIVLFWLIIFFISPSDVVESPGVAFLRATLVTGAGYWGYTSYKKEKKGSKKG